MITAQITETSVTNNSLSKDYPHPDDHAKQITDTPGFKPFTKAFFREQRTYREIIPKKFLKKFLEKFLKNSWEVVP